jgi:hypothetical protein
VIRNGVTYQQDTTNIGSKPAQRVGKTSVIPSQALIESPNPNQNDPKVDDDLTLTRKNKHVEFNAVIKLDPAEQPKFQPTPQEFECPRCGEEKIVGVNGSRRWCLNCLTEWPNSDTFLAEVNATQQVLELPTRQQLQNRFLTMLAKLDEEDGRLSRINSWLDTLEAQLDLVQDSDDPDEMVLPITSMPVLEYA